MNFKEKIHSNSTTNRKTAIYFLCIFALVLSNLVFAVGSHAAVIQGFKFYDLDDDGVMDAASDSTFQNHNIYVRENDTAINHTVKTDEGGHYSVTGLNAGTFTVWSGIFNGWNQSAPTRGSGMVTQVVELTDDAQTLTVNFGITDRGEPPVPPQDACSVIPDAESVGSGNWSDPNTWSTGTVPAPGEWVLINEGHEITVPNSVDLGQGGLCNLGMIWSGDNTGSSPAKVRINASSVHNSGDIIGKDGVKGICGNFDTSGSGIEIWATLFVNDISGSLRAGHGGGDVGGHDPCAGFGGHGGSVEIFATTIIHDGSVIRSGNGGDAIGRHAHTYGGDGGVVRLIANAFDPDNQSISKGMIITGHGGDSKSQPGKAHAGIGGNADIIMNKVASSVIGNPGGTAHWDPVKLKAGGDMNISGFDDVEIYTDKGGSMDLSELKEGAVTASKTITIAAGKGGTVDLRGLSGKVFQAGVKIEIFADTILLDPGVNFEDLADAPDVVIGAAKILYRVALSADRSINGEPGTGVAVPVKLINIGPAIDTYALSVTNSEGWHTDGLPINITMGGLLTKVLNLNVNFPTDSSSGTTITVTATSLTDPTVSATAKIEADYIRPDESGDIEIGDSAGGCGKTLSVPVKIKNAPNEVKALGFDVTYDSAILTYTGFSKGSLTQNFGDPLGDFDVNLVAPGVLRCGGYRSVNGIAADASGSVVFLKFKIAADCDESELQLANLEDDINGWSFAAGKFTPVVCGSFGDVNGDSEITPQDALCAFEKYMTVCPTSCGIGCDNINADVNCDGETTPADALCIFNKYLGKVSCLD
jgi:hypothetical protein